MTLATAEHDVRSRRYMAQAIALSRRALGRTGSNPGVGCSARIGVLAMEALKKPDLVAYVRFASVYRNFQEARDFRDIAGKLDRPSQADAKRNAHTNKT